MGWSSLWRRTFDDPLGSGRSIHRDSVLANRKSEFQKEASAAFLK